MIGKRSTIIILSVLIISYLIMGITGIFRMSLTFDELAHIPAGYSYLAENDYRLNLQDHPPLAKMIAAVPLLFLKPMTFTHHPFWQKGMQWHYGDLFIYHNKINADSIIRSGRIALLLVSVFLGLIIFAWGKEAGGTAAGLIGAGLFYFFPGFIANGGLVTTDVPMSLCYFLTMYCFMKLYYQRSILYAVLLGLCVGLTLSVKFSGILIFPPLCLMSAWWYFRTRRFSLPRVSLYAAAAALAAFFIVAAVYRFVHLDMFLYGLKRITSQIEAGRGSFLLGKYSTSGWWYYFPVTIILKTPLGILFLLGVSVVHLPALWRSEKGKDNLVFLGIPLLVYFVSASTSPMQIGHRHILPVYPFLFTFIGWAAVQGKWKGRLKIISGIGLVAVFFSVLFSQPYNLEYFNMLTGSRDRAYKYLVDSNLDWGQGLKELGEYVKKTPDAAVILTFFGTADPSHEGIQYTPLLSYDMVDRTGNSPESYIGKKILYAISATQRQCVYLKNKDIFKWLDDIEPVYVCARSIFVYDLTDHKKGLASLENLFQRTGNVKEAEKIREIVHYVENS